MRLSSVLTDAPDTSRSQVEGFLGSKRIKPGQHRNINVGTVVRYYFCASCERKREFLSGESLSCLVTGDSSVSIDALLHCSGCGTPAEAWFLIGCEDDLFSQSPTVFLETHRESRRELRRLRIFDTNQVEDLFERSKVAFESELGAGAMIYLRQIFEIMTRQGAQEAGISLLAGKRKKNFRSLLEEVDGKRAILPSEFSKNGYKLFGELSEIIHGRSDENEALRKYEPCLKLVKGIVENIQRIDDMKQAADTLWNESVVTAQKGEAK